ERTSKSSSRTKPRHEIAFETTAFDRDHSDLRTIVTGLFKYETTACDRRTPPWDTTPPEKGGRCD
ncbi:unnamed protein product, partial [marine sediment metagenome]